MSHEARAGGARSASDADPLLPLPPDQVRALSLEHHLALAAMRAGRGGLPQVSELLRVVYLVLLLRGRTDAGALRVLCRQAEASLRACLTRAGGRGRCLLLDRERAALEHVLAAHDRQLAETPGQRYARASARTQRFMAHAGRARLGAGAAVSSAPHAPS